MARDNDLDGRPMEPAGRLEFLDGIRGLAALYICLAHAYFELFDHGPFEPLPSMATRYGGVFLFGHEVVDLFIVLSGFCLMLPAVQTGRVRGGLLSYAKRRARRILPPYYASILLTLAVIAVVPQLQRHTGLRWDVLMPVATPGVLISHAFMFHNLSPNWCSKITGTAWTVATEAHIYAFFPLLLLCWRRLGNAATILAGIGIGVAAFALCSDQRLLGWSPWYFGLFAMGMLAASAPLGQTRGGAPSSSVGAWRGPALIALLAILGVAVALMSNWDASATRGLLGRILRKPYVGFTWTHDVAFGFLSASFLVACRWLHGFGRSRLNPVGILEWRPLVALGMFSYSLYLIHYPILSIVHLLIHGHGLRPLSELGIMLGGAVPLAVFLSYLFYLAFERNFAPTAWLSRPVRFLLAGVLAEAPRERGAIPGDPGYFERWSRMLRVIRSTDSSPPRRPWAQSVEPTVTTVPPRV